MLIAVAYRSSASIMNVTYVHFSMLDTMYLNEKVRIPSRANQKIYKGRVIAISV